MNINNNIDELIETLSKMVEVKGKEYDAETTIICKIALAALQDHKNGCVMIQECMAYTLATPQTETGKLLGGEE